MTETAPRYPTKCICLGYRLGGPKMTDLFQRWMYLEGPRKDQDTVWGKPLIKYAQAGAVYTLTFTNEERTSVVTAGQDGPKYVEVERSERTRGWHAESEAAEVVGRQIKRAKSDMAKDELVRILAPITQAGNRMNPVGRRALAATVLEIILGGRLPK